MATTRRISRRIEPKAVIEGADVLLRRSIAPQLSNEFDPFLLFDHFAFNNPIEGPLVGFPMHPHRGIETVTYMLEGFVRHRDSLGNVGVINAGDVQWMTSGRGILHEEMPRSGPTNTINGFQLWVNLPAALKMGEPRYQEVNAQTIPSVTHDGATVRLVAGVFEETRGPVTDIAAAPQYLEISLRAGASFSTAVPQGHTALAYLFEGAAQFGADKDLVESTHMIVFDDGDQIAVRTESGARFMLITGAPSREPIVPYGPFVMNTEHEIRQAIWELRNGTFIK